MRTDCVGPLVVGKEEKNVGPVCSSICGTGRGLKNETDQRWDEEGEASLEHFLRGTKTDLKTTGV